MKATAILITRESEYPKEILDALSEFDEVLIETRCPSVHRRFEIALKAKHDIVYVQDDDCIIDAKYLFERYNGLITNAITQHHLNWYMGSGITLLGYGAFFPKKMVDFTKYIDKYGMNELFAREADRVFTYLHQPHNSVVMPIQNLPRATNPGRMSTGDYHWDYLNKIKEQLCEL